MRKEKRDTRIWLRIPNRLAKDLDKLAQLAHLDRSDYLRVKLEEVAQRESVVATGVQS